MNTQIEAIQAELNRISPDAGLIISVDAIDGKMLLSSVDEPTSFDEIPDPATALFRLKDISSAAEHFDSFVVETVYCILVGEFA